MPVAKRKVFYLPGFDPRGARFYHGVYREQAARFSALSGHPLEVSGRLRSPNPEVRWTIDNADEGVRTDYSFLVWDDIIRRVWVTNPLALFARSIGSYVDYLTKLDWPYGLSLPRGPLVTLFYPALSTFVLPILLWLVAFGLLAIGLSAGMAALVALIPALGLAGYLIHRIRSFWLLRFFIFNNDLAHDRTDPELAPRLAAFARLIVASFDENWDEVLLVAHSNGCILAVPLMVEVAKLAGRDLPANFALVTLGHSLPLLYAHRAADAYRSQLAEVAQVRFTWVDSGYPPDGACYSKIDPFKYRVGRSRVALTQISPQLFRFWPAEQYALRVKNKYQLHFDYLRCGETLSPIDHVSMTAGRRPLAEAVAAFREAA